MAVYWQYQQQCMALNIFMTMEKNIVNAADIAQCNNVRIQNHPSKHTSTKLGTTLALSAISRPMFAIFE
jgi:hypothetical protein